MSEIYKEWKEDIPVSLPNESGNIFRDLAINIVGDTVLDKDITVILDDNGDFQTLVTYTVKDHCENMVTSITWSLFLTTTLLVFGLIRSLFNMFNRGGD